MFYLPQVFRIKKYTDSVSLKSAVSVANATDVDVTFSILK